MLSLNAQALPTLSDSLPDDAHYQAIGLVPGRFVASSSDRYKGTFILDGEHFIDAAILPRCRQVIDYPVDPDQHYNWLCYPRTDIEGNLVKLMLLNAYPENPSHEFINYFKIRGKVIKQESGIIIVEIFPQNREFGFQIRLDGYMPGKIRRQIWEFKCYRESRKLLIDDAKLIFKPKREKKKKSKPASTLPETKPTEQSAENMLGASVQASTENAPDTQM